MPRSSRRAVVDEIELYVAESQKSAVEEEHDAQQHEQRAERREGPRLFLQDKRVENVYGMKKNVTANSEHLKATY